MKRVLPAAVGAAGAIAAGAVVGVLGMGTTNASPGSPGSNSTLNVVGEPYGRAVAILRAQGVVASFGGSVGSDVPQSRCIVSSQKLLGTTRRMQLMLDCSEEAQPEQAAAPPAATGATPGAPGAETGGRPTPGAPGIVTVTPTLVG